MIFKKKPEPPKKLSYEDLGKMLESIYESGYIDRHKSYKMSFMKGVFGGLGGVIGATVVVSILLFVLSLLHRVPVIRTVTDPVQQSVRQQDKVR